MAGFHSFLWLSSITLQSPGQSAGCLPTAKPSMAKWTHDVYFRHHPSHTFLSPTSQETLLWLEEGGEKGFENINIWKEQFQAGEGNVEMVMSSSLQRTLASFETRPPHYKYVFFCSFLWIQFSNYQNYPIISLCIACHNWIYFCANLYYSYLFICQFSLLDYKLFVGRGCVHKYLYPHKGPGT